MFTYRLAAHLGMMVCELDERMPASEFTHWMALWRMDPWGTQRDNMHAGILASILANVHRKKNAKAYTVDDFMFRDRHSKRESDTRGFFAGLKSLAKRKKD